MTRARPARGPGTARRSAPSTTGSTRRTPTPPPAPARPRRPAPATGARTDGAEGRPARGGGLAASRVVMQPPNLNPADTLRVLMFKFASLFFREPVLILPARALHRAATPQPAVSRARPCSPPVRARDGRRDRVAAGLRRRAYERLGRDPPPPFRRVSNSPPAGSRRGRPRAARRREGARRRPRPLCPRVPPQGQRHRDSGGCQRRVAATRRAAALSAAVTASCSQTTAKLAQSLCAVPGTAERNGGCDRAISWAL